MMKRRVVGVLVLPVLVGTFPAYAVVDLTTVIFKEWEARIVETIAKVTRLDVAVTLVGPASGAAQAQTIVNQINGGNRMDSAREHEGFRNSVHGGPADRQAVITDSVNGNSGIVGINQSVGNMNNQLNAVSMATILGSGSLLSNTALGQVSAGNGVWEGGTTRLTIISNSINNNKGIIGVNQSSGHLNNQANVVSGARNDHPLKSP